MADTITVLWGIQHQKETTSDVYTQDHATNEAVKNLPIYIGMDYKAAKVIFNGAYDPNGGRFHVRVKGTKVTGMTTTGITKTANTQIMEWSTITPPAVLDSGVFDVSASRNSTIHIDIAQSSVTANTTGIEIIVLGRKEDSLEEWSVVTRFNALSLGAATKSDFASQEAVGQTVLDVTDPATGGLDNIGKFIFLEDTAAIEKCEIAFLVSQSGDS
jgi:hypothetical protein